MTFLWPQLLWLLLVLPVAIVGYAVGRRRRPGTAQRYPGLLAGAAPRSAHEQWRRALPPGLYLLALAAMLLAVARPAAVLRVPTHQETVILAIDASGSMRATDVKPTRIVAAQEAARAFVAAVPGQTRIGIVSFAATAAVVQHPTASRDDVLAAIDRLALQRGTALGSAIVVALKALFPDFAADLRGESPGRPDPSGAPRDGHFARAEPVPPGSHRTAAIVLLSDGQATIGADSLEAARLAAQHGVRVYTVGIGTPTGEVLTVDGWAMRVRLDEEALRAIAAATQGEYFAAASAADLKRVYQTLSSRILFERQETEISALFATAGAILLTLAALLSQLWFNRIV